MALILVSAKKENTPLERRTCGRVSFTNTTTEVTEPTMPEGCVMVVLHNGTVVITVVSVIPDNKG